MKAQSIPAQITTVEDKIAGNLSITQIFLLMAPVFWLMIVYVVLPPYMDISLYKVPIILTVGVTSLILSVKVKDKIVLHWLVILLRYNTRPKYYLFSKNDAHLRTLDLVSFEKSQGKTHTKVKVRQMSKSSDENVPLSELIKLEGLLADPSYSFSIKSQKRGAVYVAVEQKRN